MSVKTLQPRKSEVGGVPIARLLPNKGKQPIGAWCFLDHAGPADFAEDEQGMQVGRHPHTNLQTFSWMLEGEILHKDSLGNEKLITKHQVNLMTAGTGLQQGISHTEQSAFVDTFGSSEAQRSLNLVQLWIALPTNQAIERSFHHYANLPTWQEGNVEMILTTGRYQASTGEQYEAPTLQYSPLIGLDVRFRGDGEVTLSLEEGFEYGILPVIGGFEFAGTYYEQNEMMRFDHGDIAPPKTMTIKAKKGAHFMLIGGEPLQQKVLLWWNFVADNKAEIEQSIMDWNNHHPRFGDVDSQLKRLPAPPLPPGFRG